MDGFAFELPLLVYKKKHTTGVELVTLLVGADALKIKLEKLEMTKRWHSKIILAKVLTSQELRI